MNVEKFDSKIGLMIRDKRLKAGLTQKQLGETIGITQQAINLIEHGKRKVDINLLFDIVVALNADQVEDEKQAFVDFMDTIVIEKHDLVKNKGNAESNMRFFFFEQKIRNLSASLNDRGQKKAIEQIELLTKIPEYTEPDKE